MMIQVKNNAEKAEVIISGDILDDSWRWDFDGLDDFNTYPSKVRDLLKDCEDKEVEVKINSLGGDLFAGIAISNILKNHKAKTTAIVEGIAASSASIIAFGCDEIQIPQNAYLMIHKPSCWANGTADDLRKQADVLDNIQTAILDTYKSKSKVEDTKINEMINNETWLKGSEAKEFFNVEVTDEVKVLNCASNLEYDNLPEDLQKIVEDVEKQVENKEILEIVKELQSKVDTLAKNQIKKEHNTDKKMTKEQAEAYIDCLLFDL